MFKVDWTISFRKMGLNMAKVLKWLRKVLRFMRLNYMLPFFVFVVVNWISGDSRIAFVCLVLCFMLELWWILENWIGLYMIRMVKMIFKIIQYLILNSIVGLVVSLASYVLIGNVKFSILLFLIFFVGGLFVEWKGRFLWSEN